MISQLTSNIVLNLDSPIEQEGAIIDSIGVSTRDSSVNEEFDNRNELTHKISRQSKKIKKEGITYKELRDIPQSPVAKADAWTASEDALVLELVAEHGPEWTLIASKMNGKTRKQICDRYLNTLKPNINHGEWTREEEVLLGYLQKQFGTQWCKIAACLPFRTENQVKEKLAGEKSGPASPNKKECAKNKRDIILVVKQNQASQGPKKAFQEIPDRFRPITFEQRADRFLQYTEDPILRNFDPIFKDNFRDLDWTLI